MVALVRLISRRLLAKSRNKSPVLARIVVVATVIRWFSRRFRGTRGLVLDPASSYEITVVPGGSPSRRARRRAMGR